MRIFIGEHGAKACIILDGPEDIARAAVICKEFDCRRFAEGISFTKARKYVKRGMVRAAVLHRGRELLGLKRLPV